MPRKNTNEDEAYGPDNVEPETGIVTDANDAVDVRGVESENAAAVREGKLSAAQSGEGNVPGSDVQWPPGRVENTIPSTAHGDPAAVDVTPRGVVVDAPPEYDVATVDRGVLADEVTTSDKGE